MTVNCSVTPDSVLESELFGQRSGGFPATGRHANGMLEAAEGGTLFLDELLAMPNSVQNKLLRLLQDGATRRAGGEIPDAATNIRFISATNGSPEVALEEGRLREDLYYRLRVVPIELPPLRERKEDIPLLADFFLAKFWRRRGGHAEERPELTGSAIQALVAHSWRGNVRELQNVIEHATVLAPPGKAIAADDLSLRRWHGTSSRQRLPHADRNGAGRELPRGARAGHRAVRNSISRLARETRGGNLSKAARVAGVDRTTLYRVMERHGLQRRYSVRQAIR